ncbi:MAG TPA: hypothetical protein VK666_16840 [Chryseolinea sp.]|nr:hypothetical protein [Chryseolinea sp.]
MGLIDFLKEQGFIESGTGNKEKEKANRSDNSQQASSVPPTYFPVSDTGDPVSSAPTDVEPSFVTPLKQNTSVKEEIDPTFIKFFEDELVKANFPGPDYFEFRQLLVKTQQKMAAKGVAAPEVVLQAVLMSFEAQEVSLPKLVEAARRYKEILKQKNSDFLKGAETEKNNQLQKRQTVLETHNNNIRKIQDQLQQLELQKKQLDGELNKEKTQLEVNKTLGKEGIEKIEKAERLISLAHDYMQSTIDTDIKRLQTV